VVLHKTNTTNKIRNVYSRQVVNVNQPGTTRHVVEHRRVQGVNCNCDDRGGGGSYQSGGGYRGPVVSYRY